MLSTKAHPAFQHPIDNQIDGITVNVHLLLLDLMECDLHLIAVASNHKLTLAQLIVWCDQPGVHAFLTAADALANRRADSSAAHARHTATIRLTDQARNNPETPRALDVAGKAARTLHRNPKPRRHPARNESPPDPLPSSPHASCLMPHAFFDISSAAPIDPSPGSGDSRSTSHSPLRLFQEAGTVAQLTPPAPHHPAHNLSPPGPSPGPRTH